jgi:quercetin dioxygenase-like cupin family protein
VAFTILLPKGGAVTTVEGDPSPNPPPGPTVVYRTQFEAANPAPTFDLVNLVLDFAPGVWTPVHSHGGQGMVTVLEGEVVHRPVGGEERRVVGGENFLESPGGPHAAGNVSGAKARVIFSVLLPKGAEVTTVLPETQPAPQPAALPNTGDHPLPLAWVVVGLGAGCLATGLLIRGKRIRS